MQGNYLEKTKDIFILQDTALTAGGTVTATGAEVDRFGTYTDPDSDFTNKYKFDTANFISILDGAVADTETLSLKVYLQTSDVSGFGSDVNYVAADGDLKSSTTGAAYAEYTFTGATATAVTFDDIVNLKAYLGMCKRYVRPYVTATFSAANTDTVSIAIAGTFGDVQNNPIDTVDITGVVSE